MQKQVAQDIRHWDILSDSTSDVNRDSVIFTFLVNTYIKSTVMGMTFLVLVFMRKVQLKVHLPPV